MEPSALIDKKITELSDWRGILLTHLRDLIHQADPDIVEEWKWHTPTFTHKGQVCAIGVFKDHVKINFFKGASLEDPHGLFNAGLDAKKSRAIDFYEKDKVNDTRLKELVHAAVDLNTLI